MNETALGSNGGVHRGPDLGIRRHLIRGLILDRLAREGVNVADLKAKRRKSKKRLIRHAMTEYIGEGLERIAIAATGARGPKMEVQAWGALLRMVRDIHDILQPVKDEEKRDSAGDRPGVQARTAGERANSRGDWRAGASPTSTVADRRTADFRDRRVVNARRFVGDRGDGPK